jgi:epidermal growth factor receptor substrate 15
MSNTFAPSSAELNIVSRIFAQEDPDKHGILPGDAAARLFSGARLPVSAMGEIWNIADEENNGWLDEMGVAVAIRLMGWAQKGERISESLLKKCECGLHVLPKRLFRSVGTAGPLVHIDGLKASIPQPTPRFSSFAPSPNELALVTQIFTQTEPEQPGILSGSEAVRVFSGARLSENVLGDIWSIADGDHNGWLDEMGVTVAVRLIGWAQKGLKVSKALVNRRECVSCLWNFALLSHQNSWTSTCHRWCRRPTQIWHIITRLSPPRFPSVDCRAQD